jgi:hypothetical protein
MTGIDLAHNPLQGARHLVGGDGRALQQMRQVAQRGKTAPLGIDDYHAQFVWRVVHRQRGQDGACQRRFAAAGLAYHETMHYIRCGEAEQQRQPRFVEPEHSRVGIDAGQVVADSAEPHR